MEYQLELKQIVDFPRCRIYRNFIQTLLNDRSIRTTGGSFLFWYLILCSYANYSTSNRRMEQMTYTVLPGEWICSISELQDWFRCRFQYQAISILKHLQEEGCITYSLLEKKRLVKFQITDWQNDNTALKYNYPCKKDTGFFFFPICKAHKLIQAGKCSEMDILLDLWIHAVYNDPSVLCSDTGPVVYYRNNTGSPLTSFQTLGERWGHSKPTVSRLLKKLEKMNLITLVSFRGNHGSMIYLNNYLSIMFNISDVLIDKEEIAMKMKLPIYIPNETSAEEITEPESRCVPETVTDEQITVSKPIPCVPISHIRYMVRKVAKILDTQGISCCHCPQTRYILSPLSDCKDSIPVIGLNIICPFGAAEYRFELTIEPGPESAKLKPEKKGGQQDWTALPATPPLQKGRIGYRSEKTQQKGFPEIPELLLPDLPHRYPKMQKPEVRKEVICMSKRKGQDFPTPEENPRFHDTYQFLRRYRDATYSLKVVVHQMENQFKVQYGTSIDEFLDSVYAAGVDLAGGDIAERAKSIERSNRMLKLLESSVDLMRNNHKYGEQYYWILYYAFLSPQQLKNTEEILEKLEQHIPNISYRTYYRKRHQAIEALSSILWGYTAKETIDTLNKFFPE